MKKIERVENRGDVKGMPLTIKGRRVSKDYLIEHGIIKDYFNPIEKENDSISRQAAIDALEAKIEMANSLLGDAFAIGDMEWRLNVKTIREQIKDDVNTLKQLPSAQPEIVRCVDCVYSDTFPKGADNDMPLKCLGIRYGGVMPDWYCEHAERMITANENHI